MFTTCRACRTRAGPRSPTTATAHHQQNAADPRDIEEREFQGAQARAFQGRLYECPSCGRLMWQSELDGSFRVFLPETAA